MTEHNNTANSLAHTKWNCKYHIVFAPKYRREVWEHEICISESGVLVQRILCGHSREEHESDQGVHRRPTEKRQGR